MLAFSKHRVSVFAFLILLWGGAAQTIPQAVIEVFPKEVILPTEGAVRSTLILRNPSKHVLQNVRVEPDQVPGVRIDIISEEPRTISRQGAAAWQLTFRQMVSGTISQNAHFIIQYTRVMSADVSVEEVSAASISLSSHPHEDVSQTAEVQVHSSLSELNDLRPGYLYLEVKNKSAGTLCVREVQVAERPNFVILKSSAQGEKIPATQSTIPLESSLEIPAGEFRVIPVYVESGDHIPLKALVIYPFPLDIVPPSGGI